MAQKYVCNKYFMGHDATGLRGPSIFSMKSFYNYETGQLIIYYYIFKKLTPCTQGMFNDFSLAFGCVKKLTFDSFESQMYTINTSYSINKYYRDWGSR